MQIYHRWQSCKASVQLHMTRASSNLEPSHHVDYATSKSSLFLSSLQRKNAKARCEHESPKTHDELTCVRGGNWQRTLRPQSHLSVFHLYKGKNAKVRCEHERPKTHDELTCVSGEIGKCGINCRSKEGGIISRGQWVTISSCSSSSTRKWCQAHTGEASRDAHPLCPAHYELGWAGLMRWGQPPTSLTPVWTSPSQAQAPPSPRPIAVPMDIFRAWVGQRCTVSNSSRFHCCDLLFLFFLMCRGLFHSFVYNVWYGSKCHGLLVWCSAYLQQVVFENNPSEHETVFQIPAVFIVVIFRFSLRYVEVCSIVSFMICDIVE